MLQWDLSCADWVDRLNERRSLVPDLPLFESEATRAVDSFDLLCLADVEGKPPAGVAVGDWFRDIVRALFGSYDVESKRRYIREVFLLVPKKNSKTSNGALLMLTALLMNRRPRAKFIMTAPTQDVTELAFSQAKGAVEEDEVLKAILHVRDHIKTIEHRTLRSTLEIMTFDPATLTGQKVSGVLIDELHVLSKMTKAATAIRQLRLGMMAFPEGFMIFTTTQSEEQPKGVFESELSKARAVRDGEFRAPMLPVLYEFPVDRQKDPDYWKDPTNWPLVTPNLGRPITIDMMMESFQDAAHKGPGEEKSWASQQLNIEIGVGTKSHGWKGAKHWEKCAELKLRKLEYLIERSEVAVVGADGGGLDDLAGLAVMGREKGTRKWLLWVHAWAHASVLEDRKEMAPSLRMFAEDGDLTIINDEEDDDRKGIAAIVQQLESAGLLPEKSAIGIDPSGTSLIADELVRCGFSIDVNDGTGGRVIGVRQGSLTMNGLMRTAELRLAAKELLHGGTRLMNWCVSNAVPVKHGNAEAIEKEASHKAKIDPLMAMFDTVALIEKNPMPAIRRSVYSDATERPEGFIRL